MNFAQIIKNRISSKDVFEMYGFAVNRAGFAACPFHGEKTASLKVYDGNRGWYCFGCHKHGDQIDFVRQYFNLSFPDAIRKINDDLNLCLPIGKTVSDEEYRRQKEAQQKAEMQRKLEAERRANQEQKYSALLGRVAEIDKILETIPANVDDISEDFAEALKDKSRVYYELQTVF